MTSFRYWTTSVLTGQITADNLPLTVTSFSRTLGAIGQLTATLTLQGNNDGQNAVYLGALEPRRNMLWVSQDGVPVWCGIVWDWTHSSILDGTLPIAASTPESLFSHRHIDSLLMFSGDVFDTVRALLSYATSKIPNGQLAGLTWPNTKAGVNFAISYLATDLAKVWDAITSLSTATNFEISFAPALDSGGNPAIVVQLGQPHIGVPASQSIVTFLYPGNVADYGFPRTGSTSSNSLIATAPPNGSAASWQSQYPHGQDAIDIGFGYPLLEDTVSWSGSGGVTTQAQIDGYADGKLPMRTGAQEAPIVTVAPGQRPLLREINLGDYCQLVATSPLHPANPDGSPGLQTLARITGWTCTPPGAGQTESLKVTLGGINLP